MFRKRFQHSNRRSANKYQDIDIKDARRPYGEDKIDSLISIKALKDLPKSESSITVKVDPYTNVLPGSDPYAILNGLNRPIGGRYEGLDNLDGGNTRQFMTSEQSAFLHCFDSFCIPITINYRYLPINASDTGRGQQYSSEVIKAISEIMSLASATTFTQLNYYNYQVISSIPVSDSFRSKEETAYLNSSNPAGAYQWLISYQIILQSVANALNSFNKFRINQGLMMRMSWNRQTPKLNSYFGLMAKKSFLTQWDSLAYSVQGEYFDVDWMQQSNMITSIVSRRSNAATEPVLELVGHHYIPETFTVQIPPATGSGSPVVIFQMSDLNSAFDGSSNPVGYTYNSFSTALDVLCRLLSVEDTLAWVRTGATTAMSEQTRFNMIQTIVQQMTAAMNIFKPAMSDLRTILDVLGRVQINKWSKSVRMKVVQDTDSETYRNLIVEHIYQMIYGGSQVMTWNPTTYRWSGHTIWNMYTGIPEYDSKAGGAFLSFSTKTLDDSDDDNATAYVPIVLESFSEATAVNRLGTTTTINQINFDPTVSPCTSRMIPLPSMDVTMRAPTPSNSSSLSAVDQSFLMNALLKVVGIYSQSSSVSATSNLEVEPDNLCFVTFEIEDFSNEMITYARTNGPFVVNTAERSNMGFAGTSVSKQR